MPGQPDWQLYQSSTGPILWSVTNGGPQVSATLPVGPWRSWYMKATITSGTGVWAVDTNFTEDAAGSISVASNRTVVGNSTFRLGWLPVVAPYITFGLSLLVASTSDRISVIVVPSLLDPPQASNVITSPYLFVFEGNQTHGTFTSHNASYIMPGPVILEARANLMPVYWDVQQMNDTGGWDTYHRYQPGQINVAQQWRLLLPDRPVRVNSTCVASAAAATYDLSLFPV